MIKRFSSRIFLATVILWPAFEVMADGISYDYAQADYISDTIDPAGSLSDVEGNGIGFSLSLSIASAFAVKLAVASTTFRTFQRVKVDSAKMTALGVTAHTSVASKLDVFSNVSAIKAEITVNKDGERINNDEYSVFVDAGLRYRVMDKLELEAIVSYVKVFGYTLNTSVVGARFYFRKRLSVGTSYVANSDLDSFLITARMDI